VIARELIAYAAAPVDCSSLLFTFRPKLVRTSSNRTEERYSIWCCNC